MKLDAFPIKRFSSNLRAFAVSAALGLTLVGCAATAPKPAPAPAPAPVVAPEPPPAPEPVPVPAPAPPPAAAPAPAPAPTTPQLVFLEKEPVGKAVRIPKGASAALGYHTVEVHFATDRVRETRSGELFGTDPNPEGPTVLTFGRLWVTVPVNRERGEARGPGFAKFVLGDAELKKRYVLVDKKVELLEQDAFFESLQRRLKNDADGGEASAFIFVHGYNNTFVDAARRTAQIAVDLQIPITPVFYSWPSQGKELLYGMDNAMSDWTIGHLERFLESFAVQSEAKKVYVIAHSMGNKATLHALKNLFARRQDLREKFTEVVLAAPDISKDVFMSQIVPAFPASTKPMTIYTSHKDKALLLAQKYSKLSRLGGQRAPLDKIDGFELIDASDVNTNMLGHDYVASTTALLDDIAMLFKAGKRAGERKWLKGHPSAPFDYWKFDLKASAPN